MRFYHYTECPRTITLQQSCTCGRLEDTWLALDDRAEMEARTYETMDYRAAEINTGPAPRREYQGSH